MILNIPILRSDVMYVVFINRCKSHEISSQMFFDTVTFSFSKTKEELVGYDKYCKVKLFSGVISYGSSSEPEAYLKLSQTSMGEHVCKDSYWLQAVNYFCKKTPL